MKRKFKRLGCALTAAALTLSLAAPALAETAKEETPAVPVFQDLKGYDWASEAIGALFDAGVVNGDGEGQFRPSGSMRRADFIVLLVRAFRLDNYGKSGYIDVREDAYYYDAINIARGSEVLEESWGNVFFPEEAITREDAVTFLYRAMRCKRVPLPNSGDLSVFSDSDALARAAIKPMRSLVSVGIITGADGKLNPATTMTRAEVACMVYRALAVQQELA